MRILFSYVKSLLRGWIAGITSLSILFSSNSFAVQDAAVASPSDPSTDLGAQLIDIELPTQPGTNWWFWLEMGLMVLAFLVLAGVLYWLRNRFWRRFHLQWQLKRLHADWKKSAIQRSTEDSPVSAREDALKLYHIFDDAKRHQLLLAEDVLRLKEALEPLCFSRNHASRETLADALASFRQALTAHQKHQLRALPGELTAASRTVMCYIGARIPTLTTKTESANKGVQDDR